MNVRSLLGGAITSAAIVTAVACAQPSPPPGYGADEPPLNVSPQLHGNIARAQGLTRQAFDYMTAAQQANEYDLGGHAGNAKELLRQAGEEMKLSALAANRNR
jgi:hypothetical protein